MTKTIKLEHRQVSLAEFLKTYCESQENEPEPLRETLLHLKAKFNPTGFMILRCVMMDSTRFGHRVILPFGGADNTYKEMPNHPVSPRGLASDMSEVEMYVKAEDVI